MTRSIPVLCEKPARRQKRNTDDIQKAMVQAAGVSMQTPVRAHAKEFRGEEMGLTLRALEDRRWKISPSVSKEKLRSAGLPYEGRMAGIIYSWQSIFRAEGLLEELAKSATRENFPGLFLDLLDTSQAAVVLGYKDASSVRKLVNAGRIDEGNYITFGSRGVYRFRQEAISALRPQNRIARIV